MPVVAHLSAEDLFFDRITVQRRLSGQGDELCTGADFPPDVTLSEAERIVWSQYVVLEDSARPGHHQLVCRYFFPGRLASNGDALVPKVVGRGILIDGIDSFQVLYGVRSLVSDSLKQDVNSVQSFVSIDQWQPQSQEIVAIKLGVLIKSTGDLATTSLTQLEGDILFQVLDQPYVVNRQSEWNDGQVRRKYESLVFLPNVMRRWIL